MIIDSLGQTAKTNLKTERAEFSVSSDKAKKFFHIAVRNLYSNPIQACVVEIGQNAFDAHLVKYKELAKVPPFEVSLPTAWNPTFTVRDFGYGISHDYMMDGYTKAFESTKDGSAEMAGGFGVGRLVSLSLSTTYNVTTFIKGIERNYSVFESDNGIEILMTHEKATKEKDGTLVSVPVPPNKVSQFESEANRAFRYYPVQPIVKGSSHFTLDKPSYSLKGEGWGIEGNSNTTSAVCGIYHYPIASVNIPNLTSMQSALLGNVGLVMFFGASDLSPMANRQGLYYNDKTVQQIKKRLNEIEVAAIAEIQKKFDECKSYFEAKKLWGKMFASSSGVNTIFAKSKKIVWNGIVVENNYVDGVNKIHANCPKTQVAEHVELTRFFMSWSRGKERAKHEHNHANFTIDDNNTIFINDLPGGRGSIHRAKSYIRELHKKNVRHSAFVLTFPNNGVKDLFFKTTNLQESDLVKISTVIPVAVGREEGAAARAKTKIFKWSGNSSWARNNYSQHWEIAEIDLEEDEEGVYVGIERFAPFGFDGLRDMREKVALLKKLKYIGDDFVLYGVRTSSEEYKKISGMKDWISLSDLIKKFVASYVIPQNELQILADAKEYSNYYGKPFSNSFDSIKNFLNDIKNPHLKNYFERIAELKKSSDSKHTTRCEEKHKDFTSLGGNITNICQPVHKLEDLGKELVKNVPILEFLNVRYMEVYDIKKLDSLLK